MIEYRKLAEFNLRGNFGLLKEEMKSMFFKDGPAFLEWFMLKDEGGDMMVDDNEAEGDKGQSMMDEDEAGEDGGGDMIIVMSGDEGDDVQFDVPNKKGFQGFMESAKSILTREFHCNRNWCRFGQFLRCNKVIGRSIGSTGYGDWRVHREYIQGSRSTKFQLIM